MKKLVASITLIIFSIVAFTAYAQFMDDTPDDPELTAPAPPGVKPVIPLDKDDPTYNLWKKRRDDLNEGRKPGEINIQRYPGGFAQMGIPTFFRLPIALTPEDLKASQVEVAILGAYNDMGFGSRGASFGPQAFRAPPSDSSTWGTYSMAHMPTMVNPFKELTIVDYGDAPVDPLSTERSVQAITRDGA